jgi:DNA polymerase III epsilon subunit-like protein
MPETVYACVDVEASGPVPNPFNLVSIGAVAVRRVVRESGSRTVAGKSAPRSAAGETASGPVDVESAPLWAADQDSLLYIELKPVYPGFQDEAMAVHGIPRQRLEKEGLEASIAMKRLAEWALGLRGQPVFVGHNAVFDWAYVNYYFDQTAVPNPFGWKALDTKSLAAGVLGIPFLETFKENLARLLPEIGPEDPARKHRADYDALYQAHLLAALLNRQHLPLVP